MVGVTYRVLRKTLKSNGLIYWRNLPSIERERIAFTNEGIFLFIELQITVVTIGVSKR